MNMLVNSMATSVAVFLLSIVSVQAEDRSNRSFASSWAEITYQKPESEHLVQLKVLHAEIMDELGVNSEDAELLTWAGIITASYAGSENGLGALRLAKQAKTFLEQAMEIDPDALNGGARSSLGTLYYKVPGWPVGFGSKKKAGVLLTESVRKHPGNVHALYFYAGFLVDQNRFDEALNVLQGATAIPLRDGHEIEDGGRQVQIKEQVVRLRQLLG